MTKTYKLTISFTNFYLVKDIKFISLFKNEKIERERERERERESLTKSIAEGLLSNQNYLIYTYNFT